MMKNFAIYILNECAEWRKKKTSRTEVSFGDNIHFYLLELSPKTWILVKLITWRHKVRQQVDDWNTENAAIWVCVRNRFTSMRFIDKRNCDKENVEQDISYQNFDCTRMTTFYIV